MIFRAAKIHFSNELAKFLNQILLFLRIIIYYPLLLILAAADVITICLFCINRFIERGDIVLDVVVGGLVTHVGIYQLDQVYCSFQDKRGIQPDASLPLSSRPPYVISSAVERSLVTHAGCGPQCRQYRRSNRHDDLNHKLCSLFLRHNSPPFFKD